MSLFTVIKYPLSSPPTTKEFDNIPDEIWEVMGTLVAKEFNGIVTEENFDKIVILLRQVLLDWPE